MEKICLVSIVSAQTLPNVLIIKEFQKRNNIDKYVFVMTKAVHEQYKQILNACELNEKDCIPVEVEEYDVADIKKKINSVCVNFPDDTEYIVNITGGTKIMSIAVYNFFLDYKHWILYVPFPKNEFIKIHPKAQNRHIPIETRLTIPEYLKSYGIKFKKEPVFGDAALSKKLLDTYIRSKNSILWKELNVLRNCGKKRILLEKEASNKLKRKIELSPEELKKQILSLAPDSLSEGRSVYEYIKAFTELKNNNFLTKHLIRYLSGNWFEEYVYFKLCEYINNEYIAVHLYIYKGGVPNDLDVAFVHENVFYYIECKTSLKKADHGNILGETLYKMNSIKRNFGLSVKPILITLDSKEENFVQDQMDRFKEMSIKLLSMEDLLNENLAGLILP